jgi:hypothetical protein
LVFLGKRRRKTSAATNSVIKKGSANVFNQSGGGDRELRIGREDPNLF